MRLKMATVIASSVSESKGLVTLSSLNWRNPFRGSGAWMFEDYVQET